MIRYGLEGDPLHWGIALAAIVTLFLFINFARYIQNAFVESLRLRMALASATASWPSATARWSAPISPSRAFSRWPATTCASRCTP